jgi:hypothetical protein
MASRSRKFSCLSRIVTRFVLLILLLETSCRRAGTWVDDPRNFERAFGVDPPANVRVVRSWYWRSAHFTVEEMYYFQLSASSSYAEAFAAENHLKAAGSEALTPFSFPQNRPYWFAPKAPSEYRIWKRPDDSSTEFLLLDRETGAVFVHCAQL